MQRKWRCGNMKEITEDDRSKARLCFQMAGRMFEEGRDYLKLTPKQLCDKCQNSKIDTEVLSFFERDIAELFGLDIDKKKS